jgi:hypothetical protein
MKIEEIKNLTNQQLTESLKILFEKERRTSHSILLHLKIVSERKLFAERGFSSLFEMLIKEFKLSETSAYQRIKALELLKVVPQSEESFIKGEVNLTTLAIAQRQINQQEKLSGEKISSAQKIEIFDRIKNKTQAQVEVQLMELLPNTNSAPKNSERRISEDACRVSFNMPDRLKVKLKRLQEIWSHLNSSMDYVELIERSVDQTLSRIDPLLKIKSNQHVKPPVESNRQNKVFIKSESNRQTSNRRSVAHAVTNSRITKMNVRPSYYSVEIKNKLWKEAGASCQYIDHNSGRRCEARFHLEIDHCKPLAIGGTSNIENLRLLCRTHNLLMARRTFQSSESYA